MWPPPRMTVTTRIITFLGLGIPINNQQQKHWNCTTVLMKSTLRIMGSQDWWFGDPRTLLYRVKHRCFVASIPFFWQRHPVQSATFPHQPTNEPPNQPTKINNSVLLGEPSESPGMMYFPTKWGAVQKTQNPQNHREVSKVRLSPNPSHAFRDVLPGGYVESLRRRIRMAAWLWNVLSIGNSWSHLVVWNWYPGDPYKKGPLGAPRDPSCKVVTSPGSTPWKTMVVNGYN